MSEMAYGIWRGTLMLCCAIMLCAFAILIDIDQSSADTWSWPLFELACEMFRLSASLLLIASLGVFCIEDKMKLKNGVRVFARTPFLY